MRLPKTFLEWLVVFLIVFGVLNLAQGATLVWVVDQGYEDRAHVASIATDARTQARESHDVFCAMRLSTERQIQQTNEFLRTHPGPEPIPGVPRSQLESGLDRQRSFLRTLQSIECPVSLPYRGPN